MSFTKARINHKSTKPDVKVISCKIFWKAWFAKMNSPKMQIFWELTDSQKFLPTKVCTPKGEGFKVSPIPPFRWIFYQIPSYRLKENQNSDTENVFEIWDFCPKFPKFWLFYANSEIPTEFLLNSVFPA